MKIRSNTCPQGDPYVRTFETSVAFNIRDRHVSSIHSAYTLFKAFHDRNASLDRIYHFGRSGILASERYPQLQPCTHFVDPSQYLIHRSTV